MKKSVTNKPQNLTERQNKTATHIEIPIEKGKMWKFALLKYSFKCVVFSLLLVIIYFILTRDGALFFHISLIYLFIAIIALLIWQSVRLYLRRIYIDSLKYEIAENKLTKRWSVIESRIDTANVQVLNDVNISQDIYERFFNVFSVEARYGFADTGYIFYFEWLSKEEAHKVAEIIKRFELKTTKMDIRHV